MSSLIYEPKGKAREYSPLALNVYSGGCDHGCRYCYCAGITHGKWNETPIPRDISGLAVEARKASKQILMCFMGDPYCKAELQYQQTRKALQILHEARCSVAILTKGGTRCLQDGFLLLAWPGNRIKVGATLTFVDEELSAKYEPGAATPQDRLDALRILHDTGVQTWASIEPVIIPAESLAIIEASLPYVDAYKVGKWNHDEQAKQIDWATFAKIAVEMIRAAGKKLYVKKDLREHLPAGYLLKNEMDQAELTLPERPNSGTVAG